MSTGKITSPPSPHPSPASVRGSKREKHSFSTAIIGGGYAGMAAAVTLASHNIPVTVFESAKQLGGRARGVWHNDTQLDNGQHILLGCYKQTLDLIELIGGDIKQDFQRLPLQLTLHQRFELKAPRLPAPLHLLFGFLFAKGLSYAARLRAARFMLAMRRNHFILPSPAGGTNPKGAGRNRVAVQSAARDEPRAHRGAGGEGSKDIEGKFDISALNLLRAYNQDDDLIRLLWEPICISALNTPVAKASAQVLLNVLRDSLNGSRADSDMLIPRVDFSTLFPDRAAEYVKNHGGEILLSCGIEAIHAESDAFELITANGAQRFDKVICAASPSSAARMFKSLIVLNNLSSQIEAIPYQPIYTVYLQYPAPVRLPHPMLGFDRCISQWLFDRGQIADQHGLIAVVISAEGLHQDLTQEQLAQKVVLELREQLGITAEPLWHKVIAEKRATFSCEVGLSRPAHLTPVPNLLLAGDFTAGDYPATLEGAVRSGIRCANEIIRHGEE